MVLSFQPCLMTSGDIRHARRTEIRPAAASGPIHIVGRPIRVRWTSLSLYLHHKVDWRMVLSFQPRLMTSGDIRHARRTEIRPTAAIEKSCRLNSHRMPFPVFQCSQAVLRDTMDWPDTVSCDAHLVWPVRVPPCCVRGQLPQNAKIATHRIITGRTSDHFLS